MFDRYSELDYSYLTQTRKLGDTMTITTRVNYPQMSPSERLEYLLTGKCDEKYILKNPKTQDVKESVK